MSAKRKQPTRKTEKRRSCFGSSSQQTLARNTSTLFVGIVAALVALVALVALDGGGGAFRSAGSTALVQSVDVVRSLRVHVHRSFPHDTAAYTQGLIWSEGKLYESTGQYGRSDLRRLDPETGGVEQQVAISRAFFGEGLARADDRLIMLTWKAQRAFVFGVDRFEPIETFRYRGEGWGLCNDGGRLIMSDGSSRLTFRDLETFEEVGGVDVTLRGVPQDQLNELECVDGAVYANVYTHDFLVRIDPTSGRITDYIEASGLLTPEEARDVAELNGIAYDPGADRFYITGKLWPTMFEVTFEK